MKTWRRARRISSNRPIDSFWVRGATLTRIPTVYYETRLSLASAAKACVNNCYLLIRNRCWIESYNATERAIWHQNSYATAKMEIPPSYMSLQSTKNTHKKNHLRSTRTSTTIGVADSSKGPDNTRHTWTIANVPNYAWSAREPFQKHHRRCTSRSQWPDERRGIILPQFDQGRTLVHEYGWWEEPVWNNKDWLSGHQSEAGQHTPV